MRFIENLEIEFWKQKEDTQMNTDRIIKEIKEGMADWRYERIQKKIQRREEELKIVKSEKWRIEMEIAGLEYDLRKLTSGD